MIAQNPQIYYATTRGSLRSRAAKPWFYGVGEVSPYAAVAYAMRRYPLCGASNAGPATPWLAFCL